MDLKGSVVAVTGAARGIGHAFARRAAEQGAQVALSDINAEGLEDARRRWGTLAETASFHVCDVGFTEDVQAWANTVLDRFGRVDLLVNNAANQQIGPGNIDDIQYEHYTESFDVNVLGFLRTIESFLPGMLERGRGYILNTASSLAIRPNGVIRHLMPYVTSKGAVLTLTWSLAYSLASRGVKVSLFCPGLTATEGREGGTRPNAMGWFDGVPEKLTIPGSMDDAVDILIEGLRREDYLICSDSGYWDAIERLAANGLDPLSDFN